jgi:hypothetical protein
MKQFFTAIWDFLQALGEARYQSRTRSGTWDH